MESVENKIISKMKKCGRGSVFFVNDFLACGTRSAVNKALERLVLQGTILRAARGIYCYPKLEKVYGPLHKLDYVYLFLAFLAMIGAIFMALLKKKITSYAHAGVLAVVVLFNILIWLVEQFVKTGFEFLSVSYVMSGLLLLFLYSMIQD